MPMKCDDCKHNRTSVEDIKVDGWTAAQYVEWGCVHEDEMSEDDLNVLWNEDKCPFYEHDENLDDPCYACPGAPDYCENCNGGE